MSYTYKTRGTCSTRITVEIENGILQDVQFEGGCSGNLQGICNLVRGMRAQEVVNRCTGIKCGFKPTSCPDQLALAVQAAIAQQH